VIEVRLYRHPFACVAPEVFEAPSLAHWLLEHYEGRACPNLQIYAGEPLSRSAIPLETQAVLACHAPVCTVLESPGLPAPIASFLINFAIATAVSAALNSVFGPDPNAIESHDQESPNNQLSDRQNRVRIMERVPDVFGTVRSIPDLMMPTYFKYINHAKVEYGYYCITRGYADVTDVRWGEDLRAFHFAELRQPAGDGRRRLRSHRQGGERQPKHVGGVAGAEGAEPDSAHGRTGVHLPRARACSSAAGDHRGRDLSADVAEQPTTELLRRGRGRPDHHRQHGERLGAARLG
jgi:hypothetical protein